MCRQTPLNQTSRSPPSSTALSSSSSLLPKSLWPLRPTWLVLLSGILLLPSWCFINRGFTQWFHWLSILYLLTRESYLTKFMALQGTSICLGWYAALLMDWIWYGSFGRILYKNMPFTHYMVDSNDGTILMNTLEVTLWKILSHILDTLGHPILCYYYWKLNKFDLQKILQWDIILPTYLLSRIWSCLHCYHNFGQFGFFYFGYDVYIVDNLDGWLPAYVAESVFYGFVVCYKLIRLPKITSEKRNQKSKYNHSS